VRPSRAAAIETPSVALARALLLGVPSSSIISVSSARWSSSATTPRNFTVMWNGRRTPLPRNRPFSRPELERLALTGRGA